MRWLIAAWVAIVGGIPIALIGFVVFAGHHNPDAEVCRQLGFPLTTPVLDSGGGPALPTAGLVGLAGFGLTMLGVLVGVAWTAFELRRRRRTRGTSCSVDA